MIHAGYQVFGLLRIGVLALLMAHGGPALADGPITHTPFHRAYADIELVKSAADTKRLDERMLRFLLDPNRPIDHKLALAGAVSGDFGENDNLTRLLAVLADRYGWRERVVLSDLSGPQSAVVGYLMAREEYDHQERALAYLDHARARLPDSLAVHLVDAVVRGQIYLGYHWCSIWRVYLQALNRDDVRQDLRTEAVGLIQDYLRLYRPYCNGVDRGRTAALRVDATALRDAPTLAERLDVTWRESASGYWLKFRSVDGDWRFESLTDPNGRPLPVEGWGTPLHMQFIEEPGLPADVLFQWTGGFHCCFNYLFLSTVPPYRVVARLEAMHSEARFKREGGTVRIRTKDWSYAYWMTDFANSPAPTMIWRFDERLGLVMDWQAMQRSAPDPAAQAEAIREIQDQAGDPGERCGLDCPDSHRLPPLLWGTTLDIYYATGDRRRAREFFDRTWPDHFPERERFWQRLMDKYEASFFADHRRQLF